VTGDSPRITFTNFHELQEQVKYKLLILRVLVTGITNSIPVPIGNGMEL
jgi:hypothetical protein